jgi:hypothetical protein
MAQLGPGGATVGRVDSRPSVRDAPRPSLPARLPAGFTGAGWRPGGLEARVIQVWMVRCAGPPAADPSTLHPRQWPVHVRTAPWPAAAAQSSPQAGQALAAPGPEAGVGFGRSVGHGHASRWSVRVSACPARPVASQCYNCYKLLTGR